MSTADVRYLSDENGSVTDAVVPISLWREIASELETQHLASSPAMKRRLLEAMEETETIPFDEAVAKLGLE
jgi:hypothetical protein